MVKVPDNLDEVVSELKKLNVNTSILYTNTTYVIKKKKRNKGFLNPYNIRKKCLEDLINFCENDAKNLKEQKKVEFIKSALLNRKPVKIDDYIQYLCKESRNKIRALDQPYKRKEIKEIAENELRIFLMGNEKRATETYSHRTVLERFRPGIYAFNFKDFNEVVSKKSGVSYGDKVAARENFPIPHTYRLTLTRDKDKLNEAVTRSQSCLAPSNIKEHCNDAGTLNFLLKVDNRIVGYERLFTCVTDRNEPVLVLDNLECHNKDFMTHIDDVIAMGLAAINLMFDANFKYLIGDEERASFGLRQAFSNLDRNFRLRKLGDPDVTNYCFDLTNDFEKKEAYVLMENWMR
ncbi:MAG: hypothetical protein QXP04_02620 [Candidatus Nanoarchaeia archaeon]|nr:hypothetical protein [Candidatus Jingweiarchaeum tengchongense]